MDIRPVVAADVPLVLPMVRRIGAFHEGLDPAKYSLKGDPGEMYRGWLTRRAADPRSVFLVAQRQPGQLAGFLIGSAEDEIPIYKLKEYGFIHDLWVEEPYRHEGIARQMVMLAVEKFAAMGMTQVRLHRAAANDPAQGLFASCGFRASAVEMLLEIGK